MTALQQRVPIGEQLIAAGLITEAQLELVRREQQRNGGHLSTILVSLGFISPEALADFLGRQAGTKSVNLNRISIDQAVLSLIPLDIAKRCGSQQGIAQCVQHHVSVRMGANAMIMGNFDTAQCHEVPRLKRVHVVTLSDSQTGHERCAPVSEQAA